MQRTWKIRGALMAILAVGVMCAAHVAVRAQGATLQLQSATAARATLAQMDRAKIRTIANVRTRTDLLAAYDALKAVAENTSATREHVLLARVHNLALKLKADPPGPTPLSVDECSDKPCPLGPHACQQQFDMCIDMIRFHEYFPPGAPG